MKMSELRGCDNCGGVIVPQFYVVRICLAIFGKDATDATLGLLQTFGKTPMGLALAEVMSPDAEVVKLAGEFDKRLWEELFVCRKCYVSNVNLALLAEKRLDAREQAHEREQARIQQEEKAKTKWGTGEVRGNNYCQRAIILDSVGSEVQEPWYQTEDGTRWSSFDVRYVPDEPTSAQGEEPPQ